MCHQPGKKSASSSSMPFPCGIRIVTNLVGQKKSTATIYIYYTILYFNHIIYHDDKVGGFNPSEKY